MEQKVIQKGRIKNTVNKFHAKYWRILRKMEVVKFLQERQKLLDIF
jgi:hypothetical protein